MNKEKIWCADGVSINNTTRMSKTFVWAAVDISVLNVSIGVKLIKYNTVRHTLRGSGYIKARNLNIKYDCTKDSVLLGYDAVSLSNRLATIRGNVISSSCSVETCRNVQNSWTLRSFMICTIRCLEASESEQSVPRRHISARNTPATPAAKPSKLGVAMWRSYMLMTIRELHKRFKHSRQQTEHHLPPIDAGIHVVLKTHTKLWNNCS